MIGAEFAALLADGATVAELSAEQFKFGGGERAGDSGAACAAIACGFEPDFPHVFGIRLGKVFLLGKGLLAVLMVILVGAGLNFLRVLLVVRTVGFFFGLRVALMARAAQSVDVLIVALKGGAFLSVAGLAVFNVVLAPVFRLLGFIFGPPVAHVGGFGSALFGYTSFGHGVLTHSVVAGSV